MKQLFFIPFMLLALLSQAINIQDSKVKEVTVFRNYAKETRWANTTLPEGNSEVIITNVSTYLDDNTLQIATKGNVKILSVFTRYNYLTDKIKSAQAEKLSDSIELLNDDIAWMSQQIQAYQDELKILDENRKLSNDKTAFTPQQVKDLADLYRVRSIELRKLVFDVSKNKKHPKKM
ncbi:MAG: DUF4140 domain-containing protein [Chitinophagales bacterium]